jgi:hypothetical protein
LRGFPEISRLDRLVALRRLEEVPAVTIVTAIAFGLLAGAACSPSAESGIATV